MIEALIAGERDPALLAQHAKGKMRAKIERLEDALAGSFGAHHAVICRQIIEHIDFLDSSIAALNAEIAARLVPFEPALRLIASITGISRATRGGDRRRDRRRHEPLPQPRTPLRLGRTGTSELRVGRQTPPGGQPARLAPAPPHPDRSRPRQRAQQGQYFSAQYARIARRRGPNRAAVALAHSMLAVVWHLLSSGAGSTIVIAGTKELLDLSGDRLHLLRRSDALPSCGTSRKRIPWPASSRRSRARGAGSSRPS
jgi:transposase